MTAGLRPSRWYGLALWCGLAWPALAQPADPSAIGQFDPVHTRFGFELRTAWGQQVSGQFPRYDGELLVLPDGRRQVRVSLSTAAVEVTDSPSYTSIARGERFFDAADYPRIEFVSEPHHAAVAHDGGTLRGRLTMHGVSRIETFFVLPSECARPGLGCDVVARGSVDRTDYGLDGWSLLLGDRVRFTLRVRLASPPVPIGDAP